MFFEIQNSYIVYSCISIQLMIFTQKQLHHRLANLPGQKKELYLEKHTSVGIRIINGRSEPVTLSETT